MKVYLDDERKTPEGWVRTYSPLETIILLKTGEVTELSLDHDLGDDFRVGTGYDVLTWLEEKMYEDESFPLPEMKVHSANPAAALRMNQAINSILKRYQERLSVHNQ